MRALWIAAALLAAGCGSANHVEAKVVHDTPRPEELTGPKASPEEVSGQVPALRGPTPAIPLVPPELIPPDPPSDPEPGFK